MGRELPEPKPDKSARSHPLMRHNTTPHSSGRRNPNRTANRRHNHTTIAIVAIQGASVISSVRISAKPEMMLAQPSLIAPMIGPSLSPGSTSPDS